MAEATIKGRGALRLSWLALILSAGGLVAALVAAVGSGSGAWPFGTGLGILRYAFYAAIAGGVLAIIAFFLSRRSGARTGRLNLAALLVALLFAGYLISHVATARSVPAIHDSSTNLADMPQFTTLKVRPDNLAKIPDLDRAELAAMDPLDRWKTIHREAYGDLRSVRMPQDVATTTRRAEALARERGWEIARADPGSGVVEATATTLFFRFKDDVVVRVRPARGGSIVDMRSISRVGGSDIGVNAARIRSFLADLRKA